MSDFKDTWTVTLLMKQTITCRLAWQTDVYQMRPSSDVGFLQSNLPDMHCMPGCFENHDIETQFINTSHIIHIRFACHHFKLCCTGSRASVCGHD